MSKELDFSGISTEQLSAAVNYYKGGYKTACDSLKCDDTCPFYAMHMECDKNRTYRHNLFKQELKRREEKEQMNKNKNKNKMPELRAGMIVVLDCGATRVILPSTDGKELVLVAKNGAYTENNLNNSREDIKQIYLFNSDINYYPFFSDTASSHNYKCIWSRKTEEDLKIEKLEEAITKAEENLREMREQVKEFKK